MKSTHLHPIRTSQSFLRVGVFLLILLLACLALLRPARPVLAAPLAAGDIAVIGFNISGNPKQFTIVTLADIDGGEVIKITDAGWNGSGFMTNTSEGTITWTTPAGGISAGTVIQFSIGAGTNSVSTLPTSGIGSITVTGWTNTSTFGSPFSGVGDQILIYQNTSDFIYGFTNTSDNSIAAYGNWSDAGSVGVFTQRSELPPGLTNSTGSNVATAHALTGRGFTDQGPLHKDNNVYIGPTAGDKNFLLTEIGKDSNWTGDDTTPQDIAPGGTQFSGPNPIFTISAPNAAPTATSVTISGTPRYGETLTGNYTYNDAEGDTEFGTILAWYRADNAACSVNRTYTGAIGSNYTLVTADVGKYICFEVTPRAATGTSPGTPVESSAVGPVAATLVINEIDYDQPGTDDAEFVEIKNTGSTAVNLDSYELVLFNGSTAVSYNTVNLPNVNLAADDYYVVCGNATNVPDCDLDSSPDINFIQNGTPDAVALQVNGAVVEAVSYEGNTVAPYTEGTGTSAVDDNVTPGIGLSRLPDGTDTNNNDADFSLRCITPGATNISASSGCVNTPPTANAGGPYTVDEGGTVALDGSASSDSDGTIATYAWDLDNDGTFGETGAAATRGDETGQTPTFNAAGLAGPASFPIALRVTDDGGATDTDTSVSISITNVAPTADAGGPYTVLEGGTVTLAGSGSDPVDGLTYTWDLDGDGNFGETGAAAVRGDETGPTPTFNAGALTAPATITVALRVDDGTTTIDDTTTVSVEDNDIDHSISAVATDITEGDSDIPGVAAFTIDRTGRTDQPSSVQFSLGGTASAGTDYTNTTASGTDVSQTGNTITFAAGATEATISIDLTGDTLDEGASEDIELTISGAGTTAPGFQAAISTNAATKAITDNDDPPTVTLSLTGSPLDENGGVATVTATLSAPSGLDVTVNLSFSGSAVGSGTDYTASASSITIPAGDPDDSGSITLTGNDDGLVEGGETIIVAISTVTNGTEDGTQSVTATITDDDAPPQVVSSVCAAANPTNATSVDFTITFSKVVLGVNTGDFSLSNTGVTGASVTSVTGSGDTRTVTVNTGSGDGTIRLDILDNDTITDTASNPLGGTGTGNGAFTSGEAYTIDKTVPTVTLTSSAGDPTSSSPFAVTVAFSEAVSDFALGDISVTNGTAGNLVATTPGQIWTVDITPASDGLVSVDVAGGVAQDAAGNLNTAAPTLSRTFDGTVPTVTLTSSAGDPTSSSPFAVTVAFSEAVSGFALGDITVTNGTAGNLVATTPGEIWTVDITPASDGLVSVDVAAGVAQDAASNPNTAAPTLSRTFDSTAPTVSIGAPSVSLTNSGPVTFEITYTDADSITLAAGDVTLNTTGTATGNISVSGSGNTRTVTIDSISGDGTLGISLGMATAGDAAGNLAAGVGPSTTFAVDNTAPTVTAITRVDPDPTSSATVSFTVTLSEAVTGLDAGDFVLTTSGGITGEAVTDVTGSDTTWTVTVDTGSGDGTLRLDLADDNSVRDAADNPLGGSGVGDGDFTTGEAYTVDKTRPTVTIDQATGQADPTSAAPITFTVEFSEPVEAFAAEDITLSGTAPGTLSAAVTGGPTSYTVAVSGMTGTGTVIAAVAADVATDLAGNGNMAATSSDNEVTFDPAFPLVTGIVRANADPTSAASVTFTVTFAKNVTGVDATDFTLTSDGTLAGASVETVTGSDTTWTVTVNTGSGSGTLRLDVLDDDTIVDAAGNSLGDVGTGNGDFTSGAAYTLDRTAPTATLTAADVTLAAGSSYTFTVTYSDNLALQVSQLDDNDIRVTGPNGFDQPATFVSVDATDDGTPRTATYQISAPGDTWDAADNGDYTVAIAADQLADTVGNSSAAGTLGSFRVAITAPGTTLYLPLIVSTPVVEPAQPDLVVTSVRLDPDKTSFTPGEPVTIIAVIENRGTADAGPFWVDLSLNPDTPPVDATHIWNWHCVLSPCYGVAWYVDAGLAAGEQITLTSTEDSFAPVYTRWPGYFAPGTTDLYVYVDSWHPDNQAGAVLERDETNNRAELHGLNVPGDLPPGAALEAPELPQRPARP